MSLNKKNKKPRATKKGMTLAAKFVKEMNLMEKYAQEKAGNYPAVVHRLDYIRNYPTDRVITILKSIVDGENWELLARDFDFPETFDIRGEVKSANLGKGVNFEVSFMATHLKLHAQKIKEFLEIKNSFESCFLRGEYNKCQQYLDEVKLKFGYSNWYVASFFNLRSQQGQDEEIREYIREIDASGMQKVRMKGVFGYTYLRVDGLVSYDRYAFSVEGQKELFRFHKNEFVADLIDFEYFYSPENNFTHVEDLILELSTYCVVDRYLAFRRLMIHLIIHGDSLSESILSIKKLNEVIQDNVLVNLIEVLEGNKSELNQNDVRYIQLCESYIEGDYRKVVSLSETWLSENPVFTLCVEMYAKSLFRLEQKSPLSGFLGEVVNLIVSLYRDDVKDDIIEKLQKLQLRFINDEWSQFIRIQVRKYLPQKSIDEIEYLYSYINILHSIKHPYSTFSQGSKVEIEYSASQSLMNDNLRAFEEDSVSFLTVGKERFTKLKADSLFKNENFDEAKKYYSKLLYSDDSLFRVHANSKIILCDFYDGNVKDALETVSKLIVSGLNPREVPVDQVAKEILKNNKRSTDLPYLLDKAVVLFSYHGLGFDNVYHQITLVCENIFELMDISGLSDIRFPEDDLRFKYFLENVLCTEVLEAHECFFEIEDYFLFRISLLHRMIDEEYYYSSIVRVKSILLRIIEKLVKETCSHECGAGKVEVDGDSLGEKLSIDLESSFNKMSDFDEASFDALGEVSAKWRETEYLLSKNEEHMHLTEIFHKVRDAYMIDPVFGLDHFLNMNIRHGVVSNHLRAPILTNKLHVNCDENGKKILNKYWEDHYVFLSSVNRRKITDALYDFTLASEKLIDMVKNWMRVDTGEVLENEFLFKMEFSSDEINELGLKTLEMAHVSEFVDESVRLLNLKVDRVLDYIKNEMLIKVSEDFDKLFSALNEKLGEFLLLEDLNVSIKIAHQEIKKQIEEVAEWMAWKNESTMPFYLRSALQEAEEVARKLNPDSDFSVVFQGEFTKQIKGQCFRKLVTIFLILFDNAIKHSGLNSNVEIKVGVRINDATLEISFENEFSDVYKEAMIEKVERLTIMLDEGCIEKASGESGSGIFKIKKILKYDLDLGGEVWPFVDATLCKYKVTMKVREDVFHD